MIANKKYNDTCHVQRVRSPLIFCCIDKFLLTCATIIAYQSSYET
jgi:hypothetical protein